MVWIVLRRIFSFIFVSLFSYNYIFDHFFIFFLFLFSTFPPSLISYSCFIWTFAFSGRIPPCVPIPLHTENITLVSVNDF